MADLIDDFNTAGAGISDDPPLDMKAPGKAAARLLAALRLTGMVTHGGHTYVAEEDRILIYPYRPYRAARPADGVPVPGGETDAGIRALAGESFARNEAGYRHLAENDGPAPEPTTLEP